MLWAGIRSDFRRLRWHAWTALWRAALWVQVRAWCNAARLEDWVEVAPDWEGREN